MTKLPKIAIVGRPNVGKSALFNRILAKRMAIVDEEEGVTRDRLYGKTELFGKSFELIDTGGIDKKSSKPFQREIDEQSLYAIDEADSIIMVVDGVVGPTTLDEEVAKVVLQSGKPVCLAINKIDHENRANLIHAFYGLGITNMISVSAIQGLYIAELLEEALKTFGAGEEIPSDSSIKVAIVGRSNMGKSTLLNKILGEHRVAVSPIPGTTRDSIDAEFSYEGEAFTFIDTAGIRRRTSHQDTVEKFSAIRTERAIERCDVCVLVIDATQGLTTEEKKIVTMIEKAKKGCIILLNKWDLVQGIRMEHCLQSIKQEAHFLVYCPLLCISALTGRNLPMLYSNIVLVYKEMRKRVSTGVLNKFVESSVQKCHPPMIQGKRLRIYYMTQVRANPPHFVVFVNHPSYMTEGYRKYLINQFREVFFFHGAPIQIELRGKKERVSKHPEPALVN